MPMSSRERSLAALNMEEPDMVPISPLLYVQFPSAALGIPLQDLASPLATYPIWKAELETFRLFKMDAQVDGAYDVIYTKWPLPFLHMAASFQELPEDVKIEVKVEREEKDRTWFRRTFKTPKGDLQCECLVPKGDQVWEKTPLISNLEEDLEKLRCILGGRINLKGYEEVRKIVGDEGIVKVMTHLPLNFWLGCRDISGKQSVIELYTKPGIVKQYLSMYMDSWLIPLVEACSEHQVDIMWLDATYLGYINTKMFREYAVQDLRTIAKRANFPIILFLSGGSCSRFLEDIKEAGIACIEGLDPPPKGDTILSDAKEKVGETVCLKGNIDTIFLERETPSNIEEIVKKCIDSAAYGGGYILSAVDQPTTKTSPENMTAFVKAGRKYGKYQ